MHSCLSVCFYCVTRAFSADHTGLESKRAIAVKRRELWEENSTGGSVE